MKTSELFKKEIDFIKNEHMKNIVRNTLDAAPECIQEIPASSTGKYHPEYSLGFGGLARHIKATVGIAYSMINSDVLEGLLHKEVEDYSDIYEDVVYAALILHDCEKPDDSYKHNTRFDHPLLGANLFNKKAMDYVTTYVLSEEDMNYMKKTIPLIVKCIKSHMGKYTTSNYSKGVVLPRPASNLEWFVHSCDLLSSKKYIGFDFDKYNNMVK